MSIYICVMFLRSVKSLNAYYTMTRLVAHVTITFQVCYFQDLDCFKVVLNVLFQMYRAIVFYMWVDIARQV